MAKTLMQPEAGIYTVLTTDVDTAALFSTRVYPSHAAYKDSYPLVLYERVDSEYLEKINGLAGNNLANVTIQLDIIGADYGSAKAAAKTVRETLNAYSDEVETDTTRLTVNRIRLIDERDGFEPPSDGRAYGRYRVIQEYEIWFLNE